MVEPRMGYSYYTYLSPQPPRTLYGYARSDERNVRCYRNMRLRDRIAERGPNAQKERQRDPKPYPLEKGDWSSCDESEEDSMHGLDRGPDHHAPWASSLLSF